MTALPSGRSEQPCGNVPTPRDGLFPARAKPPRSSSTIPAISSSHHKNTCPTSPHYQSSAPPPPLSLLNRTCHSLAPPTERKKILTSSLLPFSLHSSFPRVFSACGTLFSNRKLMFFNEKKTVELFLCVSIFFSEFGLGLRAACFYSDMTKHTASPLFLLSSSSSFTPPTYPKPPPSVPVCLFVNTVQSLRPCKLPPSSTSCLPLFHHPSYPNHLPSSPSLKKKKTNLSVSLEKEISLQFHYLNLWNDGIRLCTLTF